MPWLRRAVALKDWATAIVDDDLAVAKRTMWERVHVLEKVSTARPEYWNLLQTAVAEAEAFPY
jgi:hypothetical protein